MVNTTCLFWGVYSMHFTPLCCSLSSIYVYMYIYIYITFTTPIREIVLIRICMKPILFEESTALVSILKGSR